MLPEARWGMGGAEAGAGAVEAGVVAVVVAVDVVARERQDLVKWEVEW
jgi:Flp pilus assembly pilin Flp